MARKAIREFQGKEILSRNFKNYVPDPWQYPFKAVEVNPSTNLEGLEAEHPWLKEEKLVVKPDQVIGKRGKNQLIKVNAELNEVKEFIKNLRGKKIKIGKREGEINYFIIEKFYPHENEYYLAFTNHRDFDQALFSTIGGVDVEENWENIKKMEIPVDAEVEELDFTPLLKDTNLKETEKVAKLIKGLYKLYADLNFTFFELNPFIIQDSNFIPLDFKGRLDDTAFFECREKWGDIEFPTPFGRTYTPEEKFVKELDEKTGASLKLTILNPKGRIWTLVAGGGASVIYADTVVDLGYGNELANYGEYSGNPSEEHTYFYARTVLDLMTREKDPKNRDKILLIGGGIANFTDVAETFKGIIEALREYADRLKKIGVKIYVRRGGPNYKVGLEKMRKLGEEIGLPIKVYGPETHMTRIVRMAVEEN
ncbi:MAG: ATP citrate lyase citrate-binding domain-containing protein [Candidatus Odinarchaeia archaeon]